MTNTLATIKKAGKHPIIVRKLDLGEFDAIYAGAKFDVNVLPPPELVAEYGVAAERLQASVKEEGADIDAVWEDWEQFRISWYAQLWQNISEDESRQIRDALPEIAWDWLCMRSSEMVREFRESKLKN